MTTYTSIDYGDSDYTEMVLAQSLWLGSEN